MKTINVTIVSAEKDLYSGDVVFFTATAVSGEIGVYPGHIPLLAQLKPGQVRLKLSNRPFEEVFWISGGLLEVQPNQIMVLADLAERADDLDEAAVIEAKKSAEDSLNQQHKEFNYEKALAELNIARSQLDAINQLKISNK